MSNFIYLRGQPGVGKITVARLIEAELGYKVFWFHDLKNAVFSVVGEHRIPRLMDEVTEPVLRYLLETGSDIVYVRPSPDRATIERVAQAVREFPAYRFIAVRLTASRDTLVKRVTERSDPFRISDTASLDEYLGSRATTELSNEYVIPTDVLTPRQVADEIIRIVRG